MNKDRFVNPYAFVPLPVRIPRSPAPGHGYRLGRLNATIEVSWTLRTPMLLPAGAKAQGWIEPDGAIRIPGSAIKGAVRALHEALFNGCLSTLDADFLPGYRDPASSADADDWSLALVTDSMAAAHVAHLRGHRHGDGPDRVLHPGASRDACGHRCAEAWVGRPGRRTSLSGSPHPGHGPTSATQGAQRSHCGPMVLGHGRARIT